MKPNSRPAIFVLRPIASGVGETLAGALEGDIIRAWEGDESPRELLRRRFLEYRSWILIMAGGIAVRLLDGLPADKHTDPAVVLLDEGCHHAIALLCGHEGGANELAFRVGNAVGANPVVTTATESCKPYVVGIGCRKGVSSQQIEELVTAVLPQEIGNIRCVATIDLKAKEAGLLEFCRKYDLPLRIFSLDAVKARGWSQTASDWVQKSIGVAGVCEPCALMATPRGRLVVPKTTRDGVAVAVVDDRMENL